MSKKAARLRAWTVTPLSELQRRPDFPACTVGQVVEAADFIGLIWRVFPNASARVFDYRAGQDCEVERLEDLFSYTWSPQDHSGTEAVPPPGIRLPCPVLVVEADSLRAPRDGVAFRRLRRRVPTLSSRSKGLLRRHLSWWARDTWSAIAGLQQREAWEIGLALGLQNIPWARLDSAPCLLSELAEWAGMDAAECIAGFDLWSDARDTTLRPQRRKRPHSRAENPRRDKAGHKGNAASVRKRSQPNPSKQLTLSLASSDAPVAAPLRACSNTPTDRVCGIWHIDSTSSRSRLWLANRSVTTYQSITIITIQMAAGGPESALPVRYLRSDLPPQGTLLVDEESLVEDGRVTHYLFCLQPVSSMAPPEFYRLQRPTLHTSSYTPRPISLLEFTIEGCIIPVWRVVEPTVQPEQDSVPVDDLVLPSLGDE